MWFVCDSALAVTADIHCFNTLNNCSISITNQPTKVPCWTQIIASVRQHLTFDDSWTWSYLRGVWEKFSGNVSISIINLSHMCAYSAILQLKIINDKSIEAIELSKIPRDIWARVAVSEIIARTDFRRRYVVQRSPISRSYLGYWAYRIYIYRWMVGPLWIHRYIYKYIYISSGGGRRLPVKPYFFLIFSFPTINIA